MKKLALLFLLVSILSCSVSEDETPRSHYEFLPIESVNMPETFVVNQTHIIDLAYYLPSSCSIFNDIYYATSTNEHVVAIVSEMYTASNDCQDVFTEAETSFDFRPTTLGAHVFKFWQGEQVVDGASEGTYLIYAIEVVE